MLEDDSPGAVIAGAAAVAFVDNDKVEKILGVIAEQSFAALIFGERLVDGKIHLAALDELAGFDLVARIAKGGKEPILGLVDENVAIGEIEDAGPPVFT